MRNTLSVRLNQDLAAWLEQASLRSGVPQGQIVREQLEKARATAPGRKFMRLAGAQKGGPRDVSERKGFSRS